MAAPSGGRSIGGALEIVECDGVLEELLAVSCSVSFSAVILRSTDVGVNANGVGEEVCCEWECEGGVGLAGEAIELAITGAETAGEGTTDAGAIVAVLLAGWFPDCG